MIYPNVSTIPYDFLHDAARVISFRYKIDNIRMDGKGELCITLQGKLTESQIKDVIQNITPKDICMEDIELEYNLHYSYSDDMQKTYVYSADGIDYRLLKTA